MQKKLTDAALNAGASGLGSFVAIELLAGDSANATMDLFGFDLTLSQAAALSQGTVQLANELLVKDYLIKYLPDSAKSYVMMADYASKSLIQGLIPAGLLYLSNGQVMTFADFCKLGLVQFLGGAGGLEVSKRFAEPLVDRFI